MKGCMRNDAGGSVPAPRCSDLPLAAVGGLTPQSLSGGGVFQQPRPSVAAKAKTSIEPLCPSLEYLDADVVRLQFLYTIAQQCHQVRADALASR